LVGWLRERSDQAWAIPRLTEPVRYALRAQSGDFEQTGTLSLDANGSFTLEAALPADAPLGAYRLDLEPLWWQRPSLLFQVEEFRTPEIEAALTLTSTPPYLPGDTLRGRVNVDYYAGGAVEDAVVEVVISRQPYRFQPRPIRAEPWLFEHLRAPAFFESASELQRLELETDARGEAFFEFVTEREVERDFTYLLEVRVRDLSRRETIARREVNVTQQAYFADLALDSRLLAPTDQARLTITLEDANREPVADEGTLRVVRERWREVYVHRKRGTEISGQEYRVLPERSMLSAAQSDYRLRESGFVTEEVHRETVATGPDGRALFTYTPPTTGYYSLEWVSRGRRGRPVTAEVPLWVSDSAATELGYRPGGLRLIADPGPHALGEPIRVLLAAPARDRWALVTTSAEGALEHRVLRVEGSSLLFQVKPDERFQPNFFLDASMVSDEMHLTDSLELIVPPREQSLEVSIEPDRDGYEPEDEATVTVRVRDADGAPVQTELAFAASDAALEGLLADPRPPVRAVFYGDKRPHRMALDSSLQARPFFQPLEEVSEEDDLASEETIELSPFSVEGGEGAGYRASESLAGTRMRTAVADSAAMLEAPPPPAEAYAPALRADFRSTLHWAPRVQTDAEGVGTVSFTFPDNLTAWELKAVAIDAQTRVGEASVRTTTRLPLIARLQLPRFLTERDTAVLSGVVQNNTMDALTVTPGLSAEGGVTVGRGEPDRLEVPPEGLARADWVVQAERTGEATFRLQAVAGGLGDAVERRLEVVPHGLERTTGLLGQVDGAEVRLPLELPPAEQRDNTTVTLEIATSLALQLVSALPYLIDYPYGCTEQTLSRFLPALSVRRAARDLGLPLAGLDAAVYGGLSAEAREGREDLRAVLDEVLADALERLARMQKSDGSWPWMPEGPSDPYMTAYA
ncbi:MAG: alpha-2-macroglobulin family protein, partial [Opitutales bacterium]